MEEQQNLRDVALNWVGKLPVVTELQKFSIDNPVTNKEGKTSEGESYFYNIITIDNIDYRLPNSVIADIKILLKDNPKLKEVRVISSGKGLDTKYTTIPIEKA